MTSAIEMKFALLLGIVQGLTEFFPVSSSAHLVIIQQLIALKESGAELLAFDLALHFGTLISVVAVFHKDVIAMVRGFFRCLKRPSLSGIRKDKDSWLALIVILGTIPAAIVGIALKGFFESLFVSSTSAGAMLVVTGAILWATRYAKKDGRPLSGVRLFDVVLIGLAQALAIVPGISRSGATISAAILCRMERVEAARYSFLLSIPAILGGIFLELGNLRGWSGEMLLPLVVGVAAAALSGFFAIRFLVRIIQGDRFSWFAYYCWAVGLATLTLL